jgi:hypothetical protein
MRRSGAVARNPYPSGKRITQDDLRSCAAISNERNRAV